MNKLILNVENLAFRNVQKARITLPVLIPNDPILLLFPHGYYSIKQKEKTEMYFKHLQKEDKIYM